MVWDKTKPAGSTPLKNSDDDIRANQAAIETALDQDHDFTSGSTQTGKHDKVTFKAVLVTKPTLSSGEAGLYTKTVSGVSELFYEDSSGAEIQLTSGGYINPTLLGLVTTIAQLNYISTAGITLTDLQKLHAITLSAAVINSLVQATRTLTAGTGLSGGGDLSADRTISHAAHTGDVTGATALTIAAGAVTQAKLPDYTAGDRLLFSSYPMASTTSTSYVKIKGFSIDRPGSLRITYSIVNVSGGNAYANIYRNRGGTITAVGTERIRASGSYEYSEDISGWEAGDIIEIYAHTTSSGTAGVENLKISTGNWYGMSSTVE